MATYNRVTSPFQVRLELFKFNFYPVECVSKLLSFFFLAAKVLQESPRTLSEKKPELNSECSPSASRNTENSEPANVNKSQGGKDVSKKNPIADSEVIDIKSILLSGGSFKSNEAGSSQPNISAVEITSSENEGQDNSQVPDEESQAPSSPINLFCEGEEVSCFFLLCYFLLCFNYFFSLVKSHIPACSLST